MIQQAWLWALLGGGLIGVSVSVMLLTSGRVAGISGILNGTLAPVRGDTDWRLFFLAGLFLGGVVLRIFRPESFSGQLDTETWTVVVAGVLVGFGTVWGSGCTSGHGVCGISRLSPRSIVATLIFIASGVLSVAVFKHFGVLP